MDVETFREHYHNLQSTQLNEATSSVVMTHFVRPALRSAKRNAKKQFKKGFITLVRRGKRGVKTLFSQMMREEVLNYLMDEGYALDLMEAEDLIQELDEETIDSILDEVRGMGGRVDPVTGLYSDGSSSGMGLTPKKKMEVIARRKRQEAPPNGIERNTAFSNANKIAQKRIEITGGVRSENYNLEFMFENISNYLIDAGYADNIDSATSILESMSDEWLDEIIEAFNPSDYEEYHRTNHIDPNDRSQEQEDDYLEYLRSKEDIRDKHNRSRGVRKKRGSKNTR